MFCCKLINSSMMGFPDHHVVGVDNSNWICIKWCRRWSSLAKHKWGIWLHFLILELWGHILGFWISRRDWKVEPNDISVGQSLARITSCGRGNHPQLCDWDHLQAETWYSCARAGANNLQWNQWSRKSRWNCACELLWESEMNTVSRSMHNVYIFIWVGLEEAGSRILVKSWLLQVL